MQDNNLLTDSDYEHAYEAALLDYKKAMSSAAAAAAVAATTSNGKSKNTTPLASLEEPHCHLEIRLMLARAHRIGVLTQYSLTAAATAANADATTSSSTHNDPPRYPQHHLAREFRNRIERELNQEAAQVSASLLESFVDVSSISILNKRQNSKGGGLLPQVMVDVDAFFEEYPHAARMYGFDSESDDEDDCSDSDEEDNEVQFLGVNRPDSAHSQVQDEVVIIPSVPIKPPSVQEFTSETSNSTNNCEYNNEMTSNQHSSMPPPPPPPPLQPIHPQNMTALVPPPQQRHTSRQLSWDEHQTQNPFQSAREYAKAGGDGTKESVSHKMEQRHHHPSHSVWSHPPNQNQMGYSNPYQAQPLQNPYVHTNARPSSQCPETTPTTTVQPLSIPDSLRRKFQPPKRGTVLTEVPQQSTTTSKPTGSIVHQKTCSSAPPPPSNHNNNNNGAALVKARRNCEGTTEDGAGNDDDDDLPDELKRFGKDLVEKITNEIMDCGDPITFADIAGLEDVKQTVQEVVCWPMKRPDLFTGLRRAPNGLLLYGPPGTGKTLIGKAIAFESGATFFSISSSSLTSKWIGEGEKLVRTLFAVAAFREPAVVFIDEIDSLLTQRKSDENEASRRIKTEFLVQLDGTGTSGQGRVLVIGATNRPQELDDAARRRFTKRLYIPLPKEYDRECLLRVLLDKNRHQLTDAEIKKLSIDTAGFSGADLKSLSAEAAMGPIRQLGSRALEVDAKDVPPIGYKHFRMALRGTKPSVSPDDILQYVAFDTTYGSRRSEDEVFDDDDDDDDTT